MTAPRRNIAALTRYGPLGASSRVRMLQYQQALAAAGLALSVDALLDDAYLRAKYQDGRAGVARVAGAYAGRAWRWRGLAQTADVLWIEKELWPWMPAFAELALVKSRPFVLDLDDAVFHNYDLHSSAFVRRGWGRKIDRLMAAASLVTAGNSYLAERAERAGARRVDVVPTVIDLERYPAPARQEQRAPGDPLVVVWVGSPATAHYLQALAPVLTRIAARRPLELRVIGGHVHMPGVAVTEVAWSQAAEASSIAAGDVGIMPLPDSPWERGKCGYKLIQYMACGLPVVGAAVGANRDIVIPGTTGLLVASDTQWEEALCTIADDPSLAAEMGAAGRRRAEAKYSLQAVAPYLIQRFMELS
jgi:glycosyltransferase involved in cell wall biosynthesis